MFFRERTYGAFLIVREVALLIIPTMDNLSWNELAIPLRKFDPAIGEPALPDVP